MNDLEDLQRTLNERGDIKGFDAVTIAQIMHSGRRLRRRRRLFRGVVVTTATLTLAVAGVLATHPGGGDVRQTEPAAASTAGPTAPLVRLDSAARNGVSLENFVVTWIPRGWHLSAADRSRFTLTPPATEVANRIIVSVTTTPSAVSSRSARRKRELTTGGGIRGMLYTYSSGVREYEYSLGHGKYARIQVPSTLKWNDSQLTTFADGITFLLPAP